MKRGEPTTGVVSPLTSIDPTSQQNASIQLDSLTNSLAAVMRSNFLSDRHFEKSAVPDELQPWNQSKMQLPISYVDLQTRLKKFGMPDGLIESYRWLNQLMTDCNFDKTEPELGQLVQYSVNALGIGRPLGEVIIVICGSTKVEKTETINKLFFRDRVGTDTLAGTTSRNQFLTERGVILSSDNLVAANCQFILSFVNIPGMGETKVTNDALERFWKSHPLFKRKYRIPELPLGISHLISSTVYPNMILLTMPITEKNWRADSNDLTISLKMLKQHNLFDSNRPNLIIVLTGAMNCTNDFERRLRELQEMLIPHVRKILGVANTFHVPLVPIENNIQGQFKSCIEPGHNYVKLPDRSESHKNLVEQMRIMFNSAGDNFARLAVKTALERNLHLTEPVDLYYIDADSMTRSLKPHKTTQLALQLINSGKGSDHLLLALHGAGIVEPTMANGILMDTIERHCPPERKLNAGEREILRDLGVFDTSLDIKTGTIESAKALIGCAIKDDGSVIKERRVIFESGKETKGHIHLVELSKWQEHKMSAKEVAEKFTDQLFAFHSYFSCTWQDPSRTSPTSTRFHPARYRPMRPMLTNI